MLLRAVYGACQPLIPVLPPYDVCVQVVLSRTAHSDVRGVTDARYTTSHSLDDTLPVGGGPADESTDATDILLHNRYGRSAPSAPDINTPRDDWKDPVRPDNQAGDFYGTQRRPTYVVQSTDSRSKTLRSIDDTDRHMVDPVSHEGFRGRPDVGRHSTSGRLLPSDRFSAYRKWVHGNQMVT